MAPPLALLDEILEEILLRLPPNDPARLVHAALVCRAWCRLVADRGFRRRYREFHGAAPMLGFVHNLSRMPQFVPTSSFRPRDAGGLYWVVVDVRHGRVLLRRPDSEHLYFEVWDPITDERKALPRLKGLLSDKFVWSAAVFCAASKSGTCDHLDCQGGPTLAVFAAGFAFNLGPTYLRALFCVYVYSLEDGSWSGPMSEPVPAVLHPYSARATMMPHSALAGKLLYFAFPSSETILKYNLDTQETTDIHRPPQCLLHENTALINLRGRSTPGRLCQKL